MSARTRDQRNAPRRQRWIVVSLGSAMLILAAMGVYFASRGMQSETTSATSPEHAKARLTSLKLPAVPGSLLDQHAVLEASVGDWQSERFHDQAARQLRALAKLVQEWPSVSDDRITECIDARFQCGPLGGDDAREVFRDDALQVLRADVSDSLADAASGMAAFRGAIDHWLQSLGALQQIRMDSKISQVGLQGETDSVTTRVHITLSGLASSKPFQQNAIWHCRWTQTDDLSPPLLKTIQVEDFEQVTSVAHAERVFADCTESVLAGNACFREQFCRGASHWCQRLVARMGVYLRSLHGVAVADVNGDGLDDLYVCEPGGLPNRLFLQNADGSARDASAKSGVNLLEPTRSAVIADFDNDGHQDIALAMIYSAVAIFRGNGDGQFSLAQAIPVRGKAYSLAAADYDRDGRLDLFVCVYNDVAGEIGESGGGIPEPYYDANQGAANILLRNQGRLEFRDLTARTGLDVNNRRFSYAAAWEDFDNDGDQDLYVANDFGRNNLYRNDGAGFVDIAPDAGVEDIASGMGVTWADYDNDGFMDLYVANMWSAAGTRVTFQDKFPAKDEAARALFQRLARGNSLFRNRGNGSFEDRSLMARVTMGRWAWGSNFFDLNNDGFEDLVVANGFVTGQDAEDL